MKNTNELKKFMQPYGGMAALKFMLESVGVAELTSQAVHSFNRQAIPSKYAPAVALIKHKFNVDLTPFVRERESGRVLAPETVKTIYPSLFKKLNGEGFGFVASEMNIHKNDLFKNPPKRFNHYSLQKLLTQKLTPEIRTYFVRYLKVEKEIEADEMAQESGLLG